MRNRAPGTALPPSTQATLRELIAAEGMNALAARMGVSRSAVAQGAAGGVVHYGTRLAIELGLRAGEGRAAG